MRIACPVPTPNTRAAIPVRAVKSGRMDLNNPEFTVDVVEAMMKEFSAARAGPADCIRIDVTAANPNSKNAARLISANAP